MHGWQAPQAQNNLSLEWPRTKARSAKWREDTRTRRQQRATISQLREAKESELASCGLSRDRHVNWVPACNLDFALCRSMNHVAGRQAV